MEVITKYKAADGTEFWSQELCAHHEALCEEIAGVMLMLPLVVIDGPSSVQLDAAAVLKVQRALVDIFEREHPGMKDGHTAWARSAEVPAGRSLIGRYVDDTGCAPERGAWGRLACIDRSFRQYEQPYYAMRADRGVA